MYATVFKHALLISDGEMTEAGMGAAWKRDSTDNRYV